MTTWADSVRSCKQCEKSFSPGRWNRFYCDPCRSQCLVEGCDKPMCAGGLCAGHRFQMRKHGRIVSVDLREPRGDQSRRSAPSDPLTLTCQGCAKEFRVPSGIAVAKDGTITRKFCTKACMVATLDPKPTFKCERCGKVTVRRKQPTTKSYNYEQKFCSTTCRHAAQFKGGFIDKNGYRIIQIGGRATPEHRYVMEQHLGRRLTPEETVHHKNDGSRTQNDINNLELWSSRHPKGQRIEDKVDFAIEILRLYADVAEEKGVRLTSLRAGSVNYYGVEIPDFWARGDAAIVSDGGSQEETK